MNMEGMIMSKLIMAMGATHIEKQKLAKIISMIENNAKKSFDVNFDHIDKVMQYEPHFNDGIVLYDHMRYVAEEKYDGFSYISPNDGKFFSRRLSTAKGNEGMPVEKTSNIPHLESAMKLLYETLGVDVQGEVYKPGGTSDDVTSIMGCTPELAIDRQCGEDNKLHYMIVDIRKYQGVDVTKEPYYIRRALLDYINMYFLEGRWLGRYVHIPDVILHPVSAYRDIIRRGGEGLMIKDISSLYYPGKKPAGKWIKCKKEVKADVVIMGVNDNGTGKNADKFGSLKIGLYIGDKFVDAGSVSSGITDELRQKIADNMGDYMFETIEISAMEYNTKTNKFRSPRFIRLRPDKNSYDCTPGFIVPNADLI